MSVRVFEYLFGIIFFEFFVFKFLNLKSRSNLIIDLVSKKCLKKDLYFFSRTRTYYLILLTKYSRLKFYTCCSLINMFCLIKTIIVTEFSSSKTFISGKVKYLCKSVHKYTFRTIKHSKCLSS